MILFFLTAHGYAQTDSAAAEGEMQTLFALESGDESESEVQDVSGLLFAARDVFVQFAAFQFGAAGYRMRGYAMSSQDIMVNGIVMNNPETGIASWSSWGGLNDVTRFTEARFGNAPGRYGYHGAGGFVHIDSRASLFKKSTRATLSTANRSYRGRFMLTHSTGMLESGWSFAASASVRYGNEVVIPGTYFNASAFYFSAEKQIGDGHSAGLTFFLAPVEQGRTTAATREVHELTGNGYYNANWGTQAGKVRNSAVSQSSKPTVVFNHSIKLGRRSNLQSAVAFQRGRESFSAINSHRAPSVKPDYYRNLPSYYYLNRDTLSALGAEDKWSDEDNRQLDWDQMITLNRANLYTSASQLGQVVNSIETRARYIVEANVRKTNQLSFSTVATHRTGRFFLSAGLNGTFYRSRNYKELVDLLGATFWLDVDDFAAVMGAEQMLMENDIDRPGRKVRAGESFGYDYSIAMLRAGAWTQVEYTGNRVDGYVAVSASHNAVQRIGHMANGKFPNNSRGAGAKLTFPESSVKAGLTLKLNGRHYLQSNVLAATDMPNVSAIYQSPRTRNDVIPLARNARTFSADWSYHINAPGFRVRFTHYYTQVHNSSWSRIYWDDENNTSVNLFLYNGTQRHHGVEIGIEKTINVSHVIQGALGMGKFNWTKNPSLSGWRDNNGEALFSDETVNFSHIYVGGTPQAVAGAGYRYTSPKRWFIGSNLNYFSGSFVEASPVRRTESYQERFSAGERDELLSVISQEMLPSYFLASAIVGKSWRLKHKRIFAAMLSINNILNERDVLMRGYEQLRFDPARPQLFPAKFTRVYPFSYMINITFTQ